MRPVALSRSASVVSITIAACVLLFAPAAAQIPGQVDPNELRTATEVYEALARQFRDGRPAPEFRMGSRAIQIASFDIQAAAVELEAPAYRVARSFGADSLNALAYLLGHELAHYYMDHARRAGLDLWFAGLGGGPEAASPDPVPANVARALAVQDSLTRIAQSRELEMEADLKAGFYSYLAGFRPLPIAPQFLRAVFAAYPQEPTPSETHPPLADRLVIVERVDSALTNLIDVFDGGVRLLVVGRFAEASRVFDHVARSFPSREVLSNAGVARALWALELLGDSARYAYPFELDAETRLTNRGDRGGFGFGSGSADHMLALRLAREARELFEQASARDPQYATAQVNLAAMYDVLGEHQIALALAGMAARTAEATGERATLAHARIVEAIAQAQLGQQAAALTSLQSARAGAPALAEVNEQIVRTGRRAEAATPNGEVPAPGREQIGGIGTSPNDQGRMASPDLQISLGAVDRARPGIGIYAKRLDAVPALLIGNESELVFMVRTPDGYTGESARGVRIGSSAGELRERYGSPGRIVAARQGAFHVYELSRIAFQVDPAGRVAGWMIYTF